MKSNLTIPGAIILAGAIVALAIIFVGGGFENSQLRASPAQPQPSNGPRVNPVTKEDHLLGNPNAPITIVEYSDLECPFCKRFHATMKQVIKEYGESGQVAWVYRHFPLDSIHPKARKEAEASECAAELGGHVKFWEYVDRLFEVTPSNNRLDPLLLPQIAEEIGLDRSAFQTCLESGKYADEIERDLQDALNAGARGTPFSVIITKEGLARPISGALPFETMKGLIEEALKNQ